MKPTIGRIVIYRYHGSEKLPSAAEECPAIITRVHTPTTVNLKLLEDGDANRWRTSVTHGDGPMNWRWPEIETADA